MTRYRATVLAALLTAGCTVSVATPPGAGKALAPRAKATARASKAPASPVAGAAGKASAAPAIAASASPTAAGAPLAFPTKVLPELPASLVAAGGGNLVGPDGASLIGMDGASLIGMDGASALGGAAAGYALAQAFPMPSPGATCAPPTIPIAPGRLLKAELQNFLQNTAGVEQVLADAAKLGLVPGVPLTEVGPGMGGKEEPMTFLLERRGEGGLLRIGTGETITEENLLMALAFTSTQAGELLYRLDFAQRGLETGLKVKFDLAKGVSSSDLVMKTELMGFTTVGRRQVTVTKLPPAGPAAPTTRLAVGSVLDSNAPCGHERKLMAVHYLADGRAAMQLGVSEVVGAPIRFFAQDGKLHDALAPTTGFYVDQAGMYTSGDAVVAALGPALPVRTDLPADVPPAPDPKALYADPAFAVP